MSTTLFQRALAPAALVGLGLSLQAQLTISEVLPDPVGLDPGRQIVEIHNVSGQPLDLAPYRLTAGGVLPLADGSFDLPALVVPVDQLVRVHWGEVGTDDPWDVHTGLGVEPLPLPVGSLSLLTMDGQKVVDYVQWGGTAYGIVPAVRQHQWTYGTWVPTPGEDRSLAYDGVGKDEHAWFVDLTPTLGEANTLPGMPHLEAYGEGCPGSLGTPLIGTDYGPPALGNQSFTLTASNALPESLAGFGLSPGAAALHFGDCLFMIDFGQPGFAVLGLQPVSTLGVATQPLPIPHATVLLGQDFFAQALVIDPDAATGYAFTRGLEIEL